MAILGFLGLSVLELGRGTRQTDGRTDTHRPSFYNASVYGGRSIIIIVNGCYNTHDEAADDHGKQEERNADIGRAPYTVPHGLNPFATQDAEHDHERTQKVLEVPAWQFLPAMVLDGQVVVGAEHLHAHHGEDEDDNGEYEAEVAERAHRPTDDADEQVQRWPRLGQLEYPQLQYMHSRPSITHKAESQHTTSHNTPDE